MIVNVRRSPPVTLPKLYLVGVPGLLGGAATKIAHLIRLLHRSFDLTVVLPHISFAKDRCIPRLTEPYGVQTVVFGDLPKKVEGVALAICHLQFFTSGMAYETKARGLKLVWSNEMMFPFDGEAEAVKHGLIDRVLFVSSFQADAFANLYCGVPSFRTGNYVDPEDYPVVERANEVFTLGRLSRPDRFKYPVDFPVFYEELGLREVRYRVMGWNHLLQQQYRWHRFGPQWELLPPQKESARAFLHSLDVFLYPLGHRVKESWGRAVVEAMLTGCIPVVPSGHQFHHLLVHGESGFICQEYHEYRSAMRELYENYALRRRMSQHCAEYAREAICNPEKHRRTWLEALSF